MLCNFSFCSMPRVLPLGDFWWPFSGRRSGNMLEGSSSSLYFWVLKLSSQAYQWQILWRWSGRSRKFAPSWDFSILLGYIFSVVGRKARGVNLDSSPMCLPAASGSPMAAPKSHDFEVGGTGVDSFPCAFLLHVVSQSLPRNSGF